jgi:hypothetical protein
VKKILGLLFLVFVISGCFPFGGQQRTIVGNYQLEQWEDFETYYLCKKGEEFSGGGLIEGTVKSLGWNSNYIVAKRYSTYRGDPDGWMIIDVKSGKISGPLNDADFAARSELKSIQTFEPDAAWNKLK